MLSIIPTPFKLRDWYHAEDRLKRLADTVFPSPAECQTWLVQVTEALWQGQVQEVLLAAQQHR